MELRLKGGHWLDDLGVWLSILCIIHCFLTPVLVVFLPTLSLFGLSESMHTVLAFILPTIALLSFIPGYRSHRNKLVIINGFVGLSLIVAGASISELGGQFVETGITLLGGGFLILAHVHNRSLLRHCHGHQPGRSAVPVRQA